MDDSERIRKIVGTPRGERKPLRRAWELHCLLLKLRGELPLQMMGMYENLLVGLTLFETGAKPATANRRPPLNQLTDGLLLC